MSYTNGQIPASALVPVAGHPNARLLPGTAAAWATVRAEVAARFGWTPALTGDLDAYRPYATQESLFRQRYSPTPLLGRPTKSWLGRLWWLRPGMATAATPGTSNHWLGITVDVTGLGGFSGAHYAQWSQVARAHLWSNAEGRSIGEAWHWTFTGNPEPVSLPVAVTPTVTGVPTITPLTPPAPITPTNVQEDDMRVINHRDRGLWLVGPGFSHHFTPEEWPQFAEYRPASVPVTTFPDGPAGARAFDLHMNVYTIRGA